MLQDALCFFDGSTAEFKNIYVDGPINNENKNYIRFEAFSNNIKWLHRMSAEKSKRQNPTRNLG